MLRATIATPDDRSSTKPRLPFGGVLPYYDATSLAAKEAWEELQRQSARQQQLGSRRLGFATDDFFRNVRCTVDMPHECKGRPGHADYCIPKKWSK